MRLLVLGVPGIARQQDEPLCSVEGGRVPADQGEAAGGREHGATRSAKSGDSGDRHAEARGLRETSAMPQKRALLPTAVLRGRSEDGRDRALPSPRDRLWVFAPALSVWSVLYVLPHVYWAVGGDFGFSTLKPSATAQEGWQAINALASVILLLPVAIGLALPRARSHRLARALLLTACLGGASIAMSHGVYGIVYRVLNIVGVVDIDGQRFTTAQHPWVLWDLFVFEPWFLIEGGLFAGAGWASMSGAESGRRWLLGCLVGISLAMASGVLGLRVG